MKNNLLNCLEKFNDIKKHLEVARGLMKAHKVYKNANVINVFTKEVICADIAVENDIIVGIGTYAGETEIDLTGKYVCPGLIDAHMHIESTMLLPHELEKILLPSGTTTVIADPHEIANVAGIDGIQYLINNSEDILMDVYFMLPSCVPATSFETTGSDFTDEDIKKLANHDRVLGLGEFMNVPAILQCENDAINKIRAIEDKIIDGHAPNINGNDLEAYRFAGVATDHECYNFEDALAKARSGFYILVREGSAAKNIDDIIPSLIESKISLNRFMFCTDDKHIDDVQNNGHISENIRKSIKYGLSPIDAICMATITPAECYGLKNIGAVAAGYKADFIVLNSLEDFDIDSVYKNGKLITTDIFKNNNITKHSDISKNSVHLNDLSKDAFKLVNSDIKYAIELIDNQIATKKALYPIQNEDEFVSNDEFVKIAVIERHKNTGNKAVGILKGFPIKNAAVASSVAHDSHNIIVVGDNDEDMLVAVNALTESGGGYCVCSGGKVLDLLPLPICGLISDKDAEYVKNKVKSILNILNDFGVHTKSDPLITLSFLALPVIPEIRITDKGIFDTVNFEFIK